MGRSEVETCLVNLYIYIYIYIYNNIASSSRNLRKVLNLNWELQQISETILLLLLYTIRLLYIIIYICTIILL